MMRAPQTDGRGMRAKTSLRSVKLRSVAANYNPGKVTPEVMVLVHGIRVDARAVILDEGAVAGIVEGAQPFIKKSRLLPFSRSSRTNARISRLCVAEVSSGPES